MIVTLSGKGGVGKTTICAFLADELARLGYDFKVLVVDGDPAMTLALALGVEPPPLTLAELRESLPLNAGQIKALAGTVSPAAHVQQRLRNGGVIATRRIRSMSFDLLAMGHGEGPGCYCRINQALTKVLEAVRAQYDLVLVDNEPGLEWLNRYRVRQIDLFLIVLTQGQSSWLVADQIKATAEQMKMAVGETWLVYNRTGWPEQLRPNSLILPEIPLITTLDQQGGPLLALQNHHSFRQALWPLVDRICGTLAAR